MTTEDAFRNTVCVDLDGTLLRYEGWKGIAHLGDPLPGAVEFTRRLSEFARVVIWTTRCNPELNKQDIIDLHDRVKSHLDYHGFRYYSIWLGPVKPLATAFIDDRAISCTPQNYPGEYEMALLWARRLCEQEPGKPPEITMAKGLRTLREYSLWRALEEAKEIIRDAIPVIGESPRPFPTRHNVLLSRMTEILRKRVV